MMTNKCRHCGSPSASEFCCPGCETVYDMINNMGLSDFYIRKEGTATSKVESEVFIVEELFKDSVAVETSGMRTAVFYITSVRCAACVWLVENVLKRTAGVISARINYATYRTVVEFDPNLTTLKDILSTVAKTGYPAVPDNPVNDDSEKKDIFIRFAVGALFTMQLMLYSSALYAGYFQDMSPQMKYVMQIISWILATPVVLYTGHPFFKNSVKTLKARHASMDLLVAMGGGSAYIYSIAAIFMHKETYFDTAAMIITLIMLGRFLEISAKHKAKSGMLSLFSLTPMFARLSDPDGKTLMVPVGKVSAGDSLQVFAGDRVPVDGVISQGYAAVDESMLTGEPIAKGKKQGDPVYAGTVNTDGNFFMEATSVGKNTVLAKIIETIESVDISRTRVINLVDKISGVFIPCVIVIAFLTFTLRLFLKDTAGDALMHSVAVLVVACPCALGLAVPLAVNVAISGASSMGALVKNGDLFEKLANITKICFDKTGTLTKGEPQIEAFYTSMDSELFLKLASTAESYCKHLLARTISEYSGHTPHKLLEFQETQGQGVYASLETENGLYNVALGKFDYVNSFSGPAAEDFLQKSREYEGKTTVFASVNGILTGFFVIYDPLREDAVKTLHNLSKRYDVMILSGDNESAVKAAAEYAGVAYKAGISPFDKADLIKQYQSEGEVVAMAGDGINDAPALKQADCGVAVGRNASDIAVDSANAVLIRPDLSILEQLIQLSVRSQRIVKENLVWAFSYNVVAIPLAAMGIIHPVASAISMSASSLIVVLNSMRLNRGNFSKKAKDGAI